MSNIIFKLVPKYLVQIEDDESLFFFSHKECCSDTEQPDICIEQCRNFVN